MNTHTSSLPKPATSQKRLDIRYFSSGPFAAVTVFVCSRVTHSIQVTVSGWGSSAEGQRFGVGGGAGAWEGLSWTLQRPAVEASQGKSRA